MKMPKCYISKWTEKRNPCFDFRTIQTEKSIFIEWAKPKWGNYYLRGINGRWNRYLVSKGQILTAKKRLCLNTVIPF